MAPTILLVPGAWHTKETIAPLAKELESLGHSVLSAQLASVGNDSVTVSEDAAALSAQYLDGLLAEGKDVVIVAHSYAGFVVSPLLDSASKKTRTSKGQQGGIVGVIFMAAFVPPEGASLEAMVGGTLPPWQAVNEEQGRITVPDPTGTFYHDVSPDKTAQAISGLSYQSLKSFRSPAGAAGYTASAYDNRRAYILCEEDHAIPAFAQKAMVEGSGVSWEIKEMKSAHSSFLSHTADVGNYVSGLAKKWDS